MAEKVWEGYGKRGRKSRGKGLLTKTNMSLQERRAEREAQWDEYVRILGRDPKEVAKETKEVEETVEEVVDELETVIEK